MKKIVKLAVSLLIPLSAGFAGSFFTRASVDSWYREITKPAFNPPDWLFAPVWTLLYILMGISFFIIWNSKNTRDRKSAVYIFIFQIFLNFMWTVLFFGLRNPLAGLIEIILLQGLLAVNILKFRAISAAAGYLLYPYFLWTAFAAVLNFSIVILN